MVAEQSNGNSSAQKRIFLTLTGLPLSFRLDWPFHRSTSGADFWVLHGDISLVNTDGLHALVSVNLTEVVKEVLPSLERADAEGPVINALRKEIEHQQIEFLKSGKLLPVPFSSRHYDFTRNRWAFEHANQAQLRDFISRTAYWQQVITGTSAPVADPIDVLYLGNTREEMLQAAQGLANDGLLKLAEGSATATEALLNQSARMHADMRAAIDALQKKHEFERG